MTQGKRRQQREQELFIPTTAMPRSPGHPFYRRLNELLASAKFDEHVEQLCEQFYVEGSGRPSIPPGTYFRMLLVGYFEGIDSQRGIAWRCADSRSLQEFLGLGPTERSPHHSSLTRIRQRLTLDVHQDVFDFIIVVAKKKGLLKGKTLGVDTTTLEANAAMKSIVRKDSGKGWKEYVRGLAEEAGIDDPDDEDIRRFDRGRRDKKVSNKDWKSPTDPDARIGKMKDGRTKLSYKAQHAIDLDTELVVGATIHHATDPDGELLKSAMVEVAGTLGGAGHAEQFDEVAADKGYHKASTLEWLAAREIRTYIPERRTRQKRRWMDKPESRERAFRANRRRVAGNHSRELQRRRSERVERSFAHVCNTGGGRRTWLRGLADISKRYLIQVAARNLGLIMRKIFGAGTPRGLSGLLPTLYGLLIAVISRCIDCCGCRPIDRFESSNADGFARSARGRLAGAPTSTGC